MKLLRNSFVAVLALIATSVSAGNEILGELLASPPPQTSKNVPVSGSTASTSVIIDELKGRKKLLLLPGRARTETDARGL